MLKVLQEFFDTWTLWWDASEPISTHVLWGHPVFFWGRCGKSMELIAAFFLVYEIFGREKSSDLARSYAHRYSIRNVRERYLAVKQAMHHKMKMGPLEFLKESWPLFCVWLIVFAISWAYMQTTDWLVILELFVGSFVGLGGFSFFMIVLFVVFAKFARVYAWLSSKEPRIRFLNLMVLAVGIMFDLLAT